MGADGGGAMGGGGVKILGVGVLAHYWGHGILRARVGAGGYRME